MYRCVSVTCKHKTLCKISTGTPPRPLAAQRCPGCDRSPAEAPRDPAGLQGPLEPGRSGAAQPNQLLEDARRVPGLRQGVLLETSPGAKPVPEPGPSAAPAGWQRDKPRALQLSLRLHTVLPVSPMQIIPKSI